jgi:hypothetical protein
MSRHNDAHEQMVAEMRRYPHDFEYRLLLAHGQRFDPSPLPDDVAPMKLRRCFLNAYTLATAQPQRFNYFEGVGSTTATPNVPQAHGWCVDADGRVVDPTWASLDGSEPATYIGVAVPLTLADGHMGAGSRGLFSAWRERDDYREKLPPLLGLAGCGDV